MEQDISHLPAPNPRRSWWIAGFLAAVVVVLVAAAVVLTVDDDDLVSYVPGSPEAALQAYFEAWRVGDTEVAYGALSTRARSRVPRDEYRHAAAWGEDTPVRVWIDERVDRGDRAILHLTVETTWDGLLGPDRERRQQRVVMVRESDAWKVDTPMVGYYPW